MPDTQEQGRNEEEQARLRSAFADFLEQEHADPTNYDAGEEEDPRIYLSGELPMGRYVCVTLNYSSRGGETTFYLPIFDTLEAAQDRATFYDDDDLFEELPVKVTDLLTGDEWFSKRTYKWRSTPKSLQLQTDRESRFLPTERSEA